MIGICYTLIFIINSSIFVSTNIYQEAICF